MLIKYIFMQFLFDIRSSEVDWWKHLLWYIWEWFEAWNWTVLLA